LGQARLRTSNDATRRIFLLDVEDRRQDYLLKRSGLLLNTHLIDRVPTVQGFYSLYLRGSHEVRARVAALSELERHPLLDFLSVSHVTRSGAYDWERRNSWMPWLTAGQMPVFAPEERELDLLAAPDFDPRRSVVLEEPLHDKLEDVRGDSIRLHAVRWGYNSVEAEVQAEHPYLVTIAVAYDTGWRASLNGKPAEVFRANHAFQAIRIEPGRHVLTMRYRPPDFIIGLATSLLSAATLALLYSRYRHWAPLRYF